MLNEPFIDLTTITGIINMLFKITLRCGMIFGYLDNWPRALTDKRHGNSMFPRMLSNGNHCTRLECFGVQCQYGPAIAKKSWTASNKTKQSSV